MFSLIYVILFFLTLRFILIIVLIFTSSNPIELNQLNFEFCKCNNDLIKFKASRMIFNGTEVNANEFTSVASFFRMQKSNRSPTFYTHICMAIILNHRFALTAAHVSLM